MVSINPATRPGIWCPRKARNSLSTETTTLFITEVYGSRDIDVKYSKLKQGTFFFFCLLYVINVRLLFCLQSVWSALFIQGCCFSFSLSLSLSLCLSPPLCLSPSLSFSACSVLTPKCEPSTSFQIFTILVLESQKCSFYKARCCLFMHNVKMCVCVDVCSMMHSCVCVCVCVSMNTWMSVCVCVCVCDHAKLIVCTETFGTPHVPLLCQSKPCLGGCRQTHRASSHSRSCFLNSHPYSSTFDRLRYVFQVIPI